MSQGFKIQIKTDLIHRINGEENKKPRKPKTSVVKPAARIKEPRIKEPRTELAPSQDVAKWQPPIPVPIQPESFATVDRQLESVRKVLSESEQVLEKLRKEESRVSAEIKKKAKELTEKEFKMPEQKPVPCSSEKEACVRCYQEHKDDLLQCATTVKSFFQCAREVQQQYVGSQG